ncbi:hypothetical protein NC00_18495 [Xanthomonas cannabis pv. phaseoli]|uniref:Uncharacterized protein n=1 Tax=Xanthomonas cannabis pv. phaseoli TaxID=1885902 RepID=A0AB34P5U2_9XANT|nr:hypothetical protein NC00_18495 [Xanthomonas cannabis pv. phaseoli]
MGSIVSAHAVDGVIDCADDLVARRDCKRLQQQLAGTRAVAFKDALVMQVVLPPVLLTASPP